MEEKEGYFKLVIVILVIKNFMLSKIMQLDISTMLILQITTIIYHHMKKVLLKKIKKVIIISTTLVPLKVLFHLNNFSK